MFKTAAEVRKYILAEFSKGRPQREIYEELKHKYKSPRTGKPLSFSMVRGYAAGRGGSPKRSALAESKREQLLNIIESILDKNGLSAQQKIETIDTIRKSFR